MINLEGAYLGRYQILEQLGRGGMAIVYKAFDPQLERVVAIKVLLQHDDDREQFLIRFKREAQTLAKLSHPNIVKVLDYGEQSGIPYLVMDYIPNGNLASSLALPVSWREAAELLLPIARALNTAHINGIVHRDVKPSNILLSESGQPMLSDFGIAKILQFNETLELTGDGESFGTPEYMAPEQSSGKEFDFRVDIYAFGVVFYELVTGFRPYIGDTPLAVLLKKQNEPLPLPSQYVSDLPLSVEQFILRLMAKDPDERYPNMMEVAAALDSLMNGVTLTMPDVPAFSETVPANRAPRFLAWSAGRVPVVSRFLLLGVLGIVLFMFVRSMQPPKMIAITGGAGSVPGVEFASISKVSGIVEILAGDGSVIPVENGMTLVVGAPFRLRSDDGQARLNLVNGSTICIHPETEVEFFRVHQAKPGQPEFNMNLLYGKLLFVDNVEQESLFTIVNPLPVSVVSYGAIIGLEKNNSDDIRLDFDCLDGSCSFESLSNKRSLLTTGHIWLESAGLFSSPAPARMENWNGVCSDLASQRVQGISTPTSGGLFGAFSRWVGSGLEFGATTQSTLSDQSTMTTSTPTRNISWPFENWFSQPTPRPEDGDPSGSQPTSTPAATARGTGTLREPATASPQPDVLTATLTTLPPPTRTPQPSQISLTATPSPMVTQTRTPYTYPPPVDRTATASPTATPTPTLTTPVIPTAAPTAMPTATPTATPTTPDIPILTGTATPTGGAPGFIVNPTDEHPIVATQTEVPGLQETDVQPSS